MGSGDRACRECGRRLDGGKRRPPLLWWLAGAGALLLAGGGVALGLLLGGGGAPTDAAAGTVVVETAAVRQAVPATTPATAASATTLAVTTTTGRATTTTSTVTATGHSEGSGETPVRVTVDAELYLQVPPSGTSCSSWTVRVSPSSGVVTYLGCYRWLASEQGQGESYDEFSFRATGIGRATVTLSRGTLRYTFAITVQR